MLDAVDLEKHLIEMPLVARLRLLPSELLSLRLAEFVATAADRFVAQQHSPERHDELDISQTYTKIEVQPYALGDDLLGKAITAIRVGKH